MNVQKMLMLPVVLLLVVGLDTIAQINSLEPDEAQLAAIAQITKMGGRVEVGKKPPGLSVNLQGTKIHDADLVHLKGLTSLQQLNLTYTQITDTGVKKLQEALPKCGISH